MEYRLTVQHNKNDNEQSVTIINDREDAKTEYLKSCETSLKAKKLSGHLISIVT